jgi:CHAT domain-containing protein
MRVTNQHFFLVLPLIWLFSIPTSGNQPPLDSDSLKAVEMFRQAMDYAQNMEPEKALDYFKESLVYRKKTFGEKHYRLGSTYMAMAIQYKNLFQLENAYQYYRIAEEMYLHNADPDDSRLGSVYSNIGNYYRIKGNYAEAVRYQQRALEVYEKEGDNSNMFNYYGIIYNLAESLHLSDREEEALRLLTTNYQKVNFDMRNQYLNLMAGIYFSMKQLDKAESIMKELIRSIRKEYGESDYSLADQYTIYGQFLNRTGKADSGLVWLGLAEKIYLEYENNERDLGELYEAMAMAWSEKSVRSSSISGFGQEKSDNLHKAAEYYRKALNVLNDSPDLTLPDDQRLEESNFPIHNLRILHALGQTWQQVAHLHRNTDSIKTNEYTNKALKIFQLASDLAIRIRTSYISQESKILFSVVQQTIFSSSIAAAYELYESTGNPEYVEIAFVNASRAKAASLFDNLSDLQARKMSLIPDSLVILENDLNAKIAYYRERLFDESHSRNPDPQKLEEFKNAIFSNEQNRNNLRSHLERNFSEYYQLKYTRTHMTIKEVKQQIQRNEVLMEYVLAGGPAGTGDGSIYIFTFSRNQFQLRREILNDRFREGLGTIRRNLSSTAFLNSGLQEFRDYCTAASQLYDILIKPSEEVIRDKRLTIVPDGMLNYLPFEALLTHMPGTGSIHYHDLPYLIHAHPVNYAFSSELYVRNSTKTSVRRKSAIAFAPDYSTANYGEDQVQSLTSIPGILEEVDYLSRMIRARSYTGALATEARFRELAGDYDILHLAMHTLINDSLPLFSRLAFHPGNSDDLYDDGWLNTSDIYNLRLKARMTVLSACNTGQGTLHRGEGVISLARAFFYAGCPSVIMTLWDVEDRSGTAIIKEFYRNLKSGKPKDVALRDAKLSYLASADPLMSHPHFWLGYIAIGQSEPLYLGNVVYFFITLLLIGIVIVADLLKKRMARKKQATRGNTFL